MKYNKQDYIDQGYDFDYNTNFKLNIGEVIEDGNRQLKILDRCVKHYEGMCRKKPHAYHFKFYIYQCGKCGFIKPIQESGLLTQKNGYACCSDQVVVPGINDIATTDPWMTSFFPKDEEEAQQYTLRSGKKVQMCCPWCGKVSKQKITIAQLYKQKQITCTCRDGISYTNKFVASLLERLGEDYIPEYSPLWLGRRFYDFFLPNKNIIIEMDGGLGHGKVVWGSSLIDQEGEKRDREKEDLALAHNIKLIRINSEKSERDYIEKSIKESELVSILEITKVNYDICERSSLKNIVYEVCKYFSENNCDTIADVKKQYPYMCNEVIGDYLRKGIKLGWCNYKGRQAQYPNAYKPIMQISLNGEDVIQYKDASEIRNKLRLDTGKIIETCTGKEKRLMVTYGNLTTNN